MNGLQPKECGSIKMVNEKYVIYVLLALYRSI
jgi:hypothetical protein